MNWKTAVIPFSWISESKATIFIKLCRLISHQTLRTTEVEPKITFYKGTVFYNKNNLHNCNFFYSLSDSSEAGFDSPDDRNAEGSKSAFILGKNSSK